ncbi:MAG TPA: 50S ribosomal protein L24 [Planctomycetota bacterium]|jgi:large subunit ribosomal protein L24|nr:50S ribosomal protein L24 [Planctomycetota bacterium]
MSLKRLKTNDEVVVLSGKDKGKRGRVVRVLNKSDKVLVEGVNLITRHLKRNPQNPQAGGRQEKPAPIAACKVMLWSDESKAGVRVRVAGEGRDKRRVSVKTGKPISAGGRAKEKKAQK